MFLTALHIYSYLLLAGQASLPEEVWVLLLLSVIYEIKQSDVK